MPLRGNLLCCLLLWAPLSLADGRLMIRLAGGYTELEGIIEYDATFSPTLVNPFDPNDILEIGPVETFMPARYDTEEVSFEATLSYRVWGKLRLLGGYVDLGAFDSERQLVGFGAVLGVLPPPRGFPGLISPPRGVLVPIAPSPGAALQPALTATRISLDADAWIAGIEVGHALAERVHVYARAAALRASFDVDGTFPPSFEIHEPSNRTGWTWGAGIECQIVPRLSVGAAFTQYDVDLHKLDSYQLTLGVDLL